MHKKTHCSFKNIKCQVNQSLAAVVTPCTNNMYMKIMILKWKVKNVAAKSDKSEFFAEDRLHCIVCCRWRKNLPAEFHEVKLTIVCLCLSLFHCIFSSNVLMIIIMIKLNMNPERQGHVFLYKSSALILPMSRFIWNRFKVNLQISRRNRLNRPTIQCSKFLQLVKSAIITLWSPNRAQSLVVKEI